MCLCGSYMLNLYTGCYMRGALGLFVPVWLGFGSALRFFPFLLVIPYPVRLFAYHSMPPRRLLCLLSLGLEKPFPTCSTA